MAILDHFHPPLSLRRHWEAFYNAWATYIASDLNSRLPEGYFAEPNVRFGIAIDGAGFEEQTSPAAGADAGAGSSWMPPQPGRTLAFPLAPETVEVALFDGRAGPVLAGAIEMVSPANKDRPAQREAFVSKCETYLQQGVGLIIVDIVTERYQNLHNLLLERLGSGEPNPLESDLYAAAYHLVERQEEPDLDVWEVPLRIGGLLPTLPLWLPGALCLPVDLEETYQRTCREQRIATF